MITSVYNKQKDLSLSVANLKLMVPFLLRALEIETNEIMIHFVSKTAISKLHGEFFNDTTPTDCISFPMDAPATKPQGQEPHVLGEIFVCPKVAIEYAKERDLDPHEETKLYVIHGLLHLVGYDDLDSPSRRKMRQMEKKCLKICEPFPLLKKRLC